jgi:hypothetical protein
MEAIQLAISWGYDKFVSIVEDFLIDRVICRDEIDVLTRLAKDNLPLLERLQEACEQYAESMSRRDFISISICAIDHHKQHAYLNCVGPKEGELKENNWEEEESSTMTEEEKLERVYFREESNKDHNRRHRERQKEKFLIKIMTNF